jgi:hypothetical protein
VHVRVYTCRFGPMANYSLYSTELLADAAYDGAGGGTSQKGTT